MLVHYYAIISIFFLEKRKEKWETCGIEAFLSEINSGHQKKYTQTLALKSKLYDIRHDLFWIMHPTRKLGSLSKRDRVMCHWVSLLLCHYSEVITTYMKKQCSENNNKKNLGIFWTVSLRLFHKAKSS